MIYITLNKTRISLSPVIVGFIYYLCHQNSEDTYDRPEEFLG